MSDEDNLSDEDLATEDAAVERLLASWVEDEDSNNNEAQEATPPWGKPENFDADKAWRLIQNMQKQRVPSHQKDKRISQLEGKLKEYEDRDKSESEKLTEDRDSHKSRADKAESELARYKVAMAKGLTPGQAKRLVGSTEEELSADADEMLADLGGNNDSSTTKPTERLRGGGEVEDDGPEEDVSKIIADIPRI